MEGFIVYEKSLPTEYRQDRLIILKWRGRRGSNPRPSDRQSDVLTKLNYVPKFYEVKFDTEAASKMRAGASILAAEVPYLVINSNFSLRLNACIFNSRLRARDFVPQFSLYINLTGHLYLVNLQPSPLLCSATLLSTSLVMPV